MDIGDSVLDILHPKLFGLGFRALGYRGLGLRVSKTHTLNSKPYTWPEETLHPFETNTDVPTERYTLKLNSKPHTLSPNL